MIMKVYQHITELIGNTPLLRLNQLEKHFETNNEIIAKLEYFNPLSSVKDRLAFALIKDLEINNKITKDTVIIEPTSGNTGIGLAFICASKGYTLELVMPDTVSKERVKIAKALGAKITLTDGTKGMKGAIAYTEEKLNLYSNYVRPMQFENHANAFMHELTTAKEIIDDTNHHIDIFIAGVGTGGTITGVGRALKKLNPNIKVIAVEPKDSPVISGGQAGPHKIQGIGAGFIPPILDQTVIDKVVLITNEEAYTYAKWLAQHEGVFVGVSSGAVIAAAKKVAEEYKEKRIVVLLPDTGERYLSTPLYDDEF